MTPSQSNQVHAAICAGVSAVFENASVARDIQYHSSSLFDLYKVRLGPRSKAGSGAAESSDEPGESFVAAKLVASKAMGETECEGLRALAAAGAPTPACYGCFTAKDSGIAVLFMEFLANGAKGRSHVSTRTESCEHTAPGEALVADLLQLYASTPDKARFGWHRSNFIGSLSQPNHLHDRFSDFWWQDRLLAQFQAAEKRGLLNADFGRGLEAAHTRCVREWDLDRCTPRLVHGDLWSGNLLAGPGGRFYLIDPSVARSHPEQDLAMLQLFGSPLSAAQLESIAQAVGAGPGLAGRIPYWQLYPLLVHVNIFGRSYIGQLAAALSVYR